MGFIYLLSYLIDPYILVFRLTPYSRENIRTLSEVCTFAILIDILLIPIMGSKKEDDNEGVDDEEPAEQTDEIDANDKSKKAVLLRKKKKRKSNVKLIESAEIKDLKGLNDPYVERDIVDLMKNYIQGDCWKDLLANIPFLLYWFIEGIPTELSAIEERNNDWGLNLVMALKIFRLSHADEIADAITRLMDWLSDIFWRQKFMFYNMLNWILAAVKFLLVVHYFACGWVLIHRMKQQFGWVLFPFNYGNADY